MKVVKNYLSKEYGNPSSIHRSGIVARGSVEMARERVAKILNCASDEIIFTGSGTEGNNMAIRGALKALGPDSYVVSSPIEHSSIVNTCKALGSEGVEIRLIKVDKYGRYDLAQLKKEVGPKALISLSYVNNEIGTVQDVMAICKVVKDAGSLLHIDAVQALPYFKIDLRSLRAALVTFSGHKLYAPKGVGILFVRAGTPFKPMIMGGDQEFGLRSGTENVAYIVGLSKAMELNLKEKDAYVERLTRMRDMIISQVQRMVPGVILTGHPKKRSPNNASFCFKGLSGKMLVKHLAWEGIEVSSGSACSSPKNEPSHVLKACGIEEDYLMGSLRITLGMYNSDREVYILLEKLPRVIKRMRDEGVNYNNKPIFISQKEFKKKLKDQEPMQILDVRHVNYPKMTIPSAMFIPVWRLKYALSSLDKEKETIVVCYQGDVISPEVQQMLTEKGFKNVKVLKGGIFSYAHTASL